MKYAHLYIISPNFEQSLQTQIKKAAEMDNIKIEAYCISNIYCFEELLIP